MITTDQMNRWVIQIAAGQPIDPEPANDDERAKLETVRREVQEAIDRGEPIDLIND